MHTLSTELTILTLAAVFTGLLWVPIIINRLREMGPWRALRNPEPDIRPHAAWAYRLANAHRNAIENLVVFAPLVLTLSVAHRETAATATACQLFLAARVAHALIYTFGIPLLRTVAFVVGVACQIFLAAHLLDAA
jgi:uncharacterized MAPEG superfamily protein